LFLINPTYYGGTCDLKTIIEYAHSKNIIVLVDEAHGGNLYFGENLPITAMEAGADFSAVSIHKTNLSLTQSSILLQKGTRVSINRITATINILQSTSPSQLLIASLDTSRKYMFLNGRKEIEKLLFLSQKYIELLNQIPGISVKSKDHFIAVGTHDYDRTKLLIDVSKLSISGFDVYKLLADKYNVQIELAEESIILCVLSIAQHEKDFEYLLYGLKEISKQFYSLQEYYYPKIPLNYPKRCLRPRVAYHAPSITININDSLDEICAESIMVYPPGIPLIIPGEKIDLKIISSINNYIKNNLILLSESDLGKIKVVDKTRWSRKQKGEAYENQK